MLRHIRAGNRVGKTSVLYQRETFSLILKEKKTKHIYVQQKLKIHCPYTQASIFIPSTQRTHVCACPDMHCAHPWLCIVTFCSWGLTSQRNREEGQFYHITGLLHVSVHVGCPGRCAESVPFSISSPSHCSNQGY